jgi:glycosyltransferase involved in cell wall biosynthesis
MLSTQNKKSNIEKKKNFLAVGRLTYQKGFDTLIHSFKESKLYKKGWKLIILGEGKDELNLKKLVKEKKLEKLVIFYGFRQNIFDYYNKSRIFVLSSRYEGMPNALLEAISYNIPTIISDSVKAPLFFLKDGHSCITYKNQNSLDLAKKMKLLASNNKLQKKISFNAFGLIKREFSQKRVLKIWSDLINK